MLEYPILAQRGEHNVPTLEVSLLGTPEIRYGGEPATISSVKAQALFYYLITTRQPQTREKLASLFWGDTPERYARGSLRNTLYNIRRAFEALDPIIADNQTVRFDTSITYWFDVEVFERIIAEEVEAPPPARRLERLREAVSLYRGEFLEGFNVSDSYEFDDWVLFERDRLGRLYVTGLQALSIGYEEQGDYRNAIRYAQAMLSYDPLQESVHRRLMRLYHRSGDRAAALRQYETLCELLQRELGAEPLRETQQLYDQILHESPTIRPGPPPSPMPVHTDLVPVAFTRPRFEARPVPEYLAAPLIGRTAERAQIERALEEARQGYGRLVLVHGEVGVGKTRLVQEVLDSTEDICLLVGHAYEADGIAPYQPLVEALRCALPLLDALNPPLAPIWMRELARLLPELEVRLPPGTISGLVVDAEQARSRLFEGVARLLARLAELQPVVLVVDDLHWADEATLEMLSYLARTVARQRVLLIGTYRTEEAGPALHRLIRDLRRAELVTQVQVRRLNQEEVTLMIRRMAGMEEGAERFSQRIFERTAGNPFYIIEVLRSLFEQGVLRREARGWATAWEDFASDYRTLPLPTSVREVVEARLERLDLHARSILETAAVIRQPFSFRIVQQASGLPETDALDAFDTLLRASLIHEVATELEGSIYDFTHPLIREVAYQNLSGARRQHLHMRVGQTLEAAGPVEGVVDRLAYHFAQGGARDKALRYAIAAGHRAREVHAAEAAIEHYQRALALRPDPAQEAEIQAGLGDVYTLCGRHAEAIAAYKAALALSDDPQQCADLHRRIGRVYERSGDYEAALHHFHAGKAVLADVGPSPTSARLDDGIALIHIRQGHPEEAAALCQQALAQLKALTDVDTRLEEAWLTNTLGSAYLARGDYEAALENFERSLQLRRALGDTQGLATLHNNIGVVHYYRGDYEAAHEYYLRSLRAKEEIGDMYGLAISHTNLGLTSFRLGELDTARRHLRQALELCREIGAEGLLPEAYRILAQLHLAVGDVDGAQRYAASALEKARALGSDSFVGVAKRVIGEVLAAQGHREEAQRHFEESLQVFEALKEEHELAKTAYAYGQVLADWGNVQEARKHLTRAAEIFRQSGAVFRLQQVEEVLDRRVHATTPV